MSNEIESETTKSLNSYIRESSTLSAYIYQIIVATHALEMKMYSKAKIFGGSKRRLKKPQHTGNTHF